VHPGHPEKHSVLAGTYVFHLFLTDMHMLLALAGVHMFMYLYLALAHIGRYLYLALAHIGRHLLFEINYEAQGLCLAKTLVPREHVLDLDALFDVLATRTLPVYERTRLGGKIPLGEDVVREVRETVTLEVRLVETDALGRSNLVRAVHIFIVHPNGLGDVRDNKMERGLGGAASAAREQVLDGAAGLQTRGGAVLPPGDGAPLGVDESLLEDVVEDVLKVEQMRSVADIDELSSDLLLRTRRLVVGDPELRDMGLSAN